MQEQTHDVTELSQVLEWSVTQQLLPRAGRFASFPDWRTVVNKRSSAVQHVKPFLQDLLGSLASGDTSQVLWQLVQLSIFRPIYRQSLSS